VPDGDVPPALDVQQLLTDVLALLPRVIKDYAEGAQRQRDDVDVLAARAHALANGLEPPALPVQPNEPNVEVIDPQLLEIFRQEALGHLGTLDRFLES
ncbi:hypothetical protein, partial [Pseudomonas viridiflava]|uniref:hypothetical protein n=1 Tax=Pseudomonas viridiflava TaxID=33069 RepID=UPI0013E05523